MRNYNNYHFIFFSKIIIKNHSTIQNDGKNNVNNKVDQIISVANFLAKQGINNINLYPNITNY